MEEDDDMHVHENQHVMMVHDLVEHDKNGHVEVEVVHDDNYEKAEHVMVEVDNVEHVTVEHVKVVHDLVVDNMMDVVVDYEVLRVMAVHNEDMVLYDVCNRVYVNQYQMSDAESQRESDKGYLFLD